MIGDKILSGNLTEIFGGAIKVTKTSLPTVKGLYPSDLSHPKTYSLYINDTLQNTIYVDGNSGSFSLSGVPLKAGDQLKIKAHTTWDTEILGPIGSFEVDASLKIGYINSGEKVLKNSVQGFYDSQFATSVTLSAIAQHNGNNISISSKIGEDFYSITSDTSENVNLMQESIEKISCKISQKNVNRQLKTIKRFPYLKIYRKSKYSDAEVVEVQSHDGGLIKYDKNGFLPFSFKL